MTTKHFSIIAFSMISGAAGGILSGTLLASTVSLLFTFTALTQGEWSRLTVLPSFLMSGAMYGVVGGLAFGLVGAVILAARGQISEAPTIGKWIGRLVGAGTAAAFPLLALVGLWQLVLPLPAAMIGAFIGQIGGQLAGNLLIKLMDHDPLSKPTILKHSSQFNG